MATPVAPPQPATNGFAHHEDLNWAEKQKLRVQEHRATPRAQKLPKRTKKRAEDESLLSSLCALVCDNQIGVCLNHEQHNCLLILEFLGISVNLILLLFLTHIFFPRARRRTSKFIHLSYYNPDTGAYGCGADDLSLVALWIVILLSLIHI